ncbi:MAG: hypothetical protein JO241_04230, partial [Candidatus Eremiobacteraeota bacterium]|nr:hypothetical protein [Candidatus Eremiobacteraeota bacterium]
MGLEAVELEATRYRRPWYWLVVLFAAALLVTGLESAVARSRADQNVADFRSVQTLRLERGETAIDDFISDATQLVYAEAGAVGPIRGNRTLVERLLLGMAPTRSDRVIYGMGVFYAPGAFDTGSRLFGPYVILNPRERLMVNTEKNFDYPKLTWYRDAVDGRGNRIIDGPYSEDGISFISVLKAF